MKVKQFAYSRQGADIKAESDIVTEYDTVIKETESQTSGENQWRSQQKNQQKLQA